MIVYWLALGLVIISHIYKFEFMVGDIYIATAMIVAAIHYKK